MTIRELKERKNEIIDRLTAINESCVAETRNYSDTEVEEVIELTNEIESLNEQIQNLKNEIRSTCVVEESKKMEVEPKMEKNEMEMRAVEQLINGNIGEELRAVTTTANGTDVIADYVQNEVIKRLEEVAPLFAKAQRYVVKNGTLSIPKEDAGNLFDYGFVGENEEIEEKQINLTSVELDGHRCGAFVTLTKQMIHRASIDVVGYVLDLLVRRFGAALDNAVINGTVANKSFEGLESLTVADHGIAEVTAAAVTVDTLIDAYNALHPSLVPGAVFVMSHASYVAIAKLKDQSGQLILAPARNLDVNVPQRTIFGIPVLVSDALASTNIYLVNVAQAYGSLVRQDARISRVENDSENLRRGTIQFFLDADCDFRLKDGQAVVRVKIG